MICVVRSKRTRGGAAAVCLGWVLGGLTPSPAGAAAPITGQVLVAHGEVQRRRPGSPPEPVAGPTPLQRREFLETGGGSAVLSLQSGMVVEVSPGSLVLLPGSDVDVALLQGTIRVRAGADGALRPVRVATDAGRVTLESRDARVRAEGPRAVVAIYEGAAQVPGRPGMSLKEGQGAVLSRGGAVRGRPLLAAPGLLSPDTLLLAPEGQSGDLGPSLTLRWQLVPGAARYRVELSQGASTVRALEVEAPRSSAEIGDLAVGDYQVRLWALDQHGFPGRRGESRRLLVAGLWGLSRSGVLMLPAAAPPRLSVPSGLNGSLRLLIDGQEPSSTPLAPGAHRVQVALANLQAEVAAVVPPGAEAGAPSEAPLTPLSPMSPANPLVEPADARKTVARPAAPQRPSGGAPARPAPYSLPWLMRPVLPVTVIRLDTVLAFHRAADRDQATTAVLPLLGYRFSPRFMGVARLGVVGTAPLGESGSAALTNAALAGLYSLRLPANLALAFSLVATVPIGTGGDKVNDPESNRAISAGALARSAMDNALFSVNDFTLLPGVGLAYIGRGLTVQLEAVVVQAVRVRGENTTPDRLKTNFTAGLHLGYFATSWLSLGAEVHYQRWLSPPKAVADSQNDDNWHNLSLTGGPRFHVKLPGGRMFRPSLAYTYGALGPMRDQSYHIATVDLPFVF